MIETDIQKLDAGSLIDLFELDTTAIGGGSIFWHNGINELGNDIVWAGVTYSRIAIEAVGFERSSTGKSPRPILRVGNAGGLIGAFANSLDDLVGSKVIRRRTFVKYLDAVNFSVGNPQADPNVAFTDEVWFVDRKAAENGIFVDFELATATDLTGVKLPLRQCTQNVCTWTYKSAECGYTGGAVADKNDVATTDSELDSCGKRVTSCALRFGSNAPLPFGGFPAIGRI